MDRARDARHRRFDAEFSAGPRAFIRVWGGVVFARETGALAQILVVLATALLVAPGAAAAAVALGALAFFFAHEPLLIVTGMRGPRARYEHQARAWRQLGVAPLLGLALVVLGVALAPAGTAWTLLAPALPALAATPLVLGRLEKTTEGEVLVALTIGSFAFPVVRAGGCTLSQAGAVAGVYAAVLVFATLAVRRVTLRALRATTRVRLLWPLVVATVGLVALVAAPLPPGTPWTVLPMYAFSLYLVARPPHLRHIRKVGWTLAFCLALTSAGLVAVVR